jgi:hypothetical protein
MENLYEKVAEKKKFVFKPWVKITAKILLYVVLIVCGMFLYNIYLVYLQSQNKEVSPEAFLAKVKGDIEIVYQLPDDEEPSFAILSDVTQLQDQKFFMNAQNGDVLLIYTKNNKALIWRPQEKKLVEIASLNIVDNSVDATKEQSTGNSSK